MVLLAGDVLLFERKTFNVISTLIRLTQGNKFIHCGLVVFGGSEKTALILEIDSDYPARIVPFHISTKDHIPKVIRNKTIAEVVKNNDYFLHQLAETYTGSSYNFRLIVDLMLYHLFGKIRSFLGMPRKSFTHIFSKENNTYICSTLISKVLSDIPKSNHLYHDFCEPDDFANDPSWEKIEV